MDDLYETIESLIDSGLCEGRTAAKPCLIEVAAVIPEHGRRARAFVWSTGRIAAIVDGHGASIRRIFGAMSDGVRVKGALLGALAAACDRWAKVRNRWAAFYNSGAGFVPGWGGSTSYYQPPGRRARLQIAQYTRGRLTSGRDLAGRTEERPLDASLPIGGGVVQVADLWHDEPGVGKAGGEKVGEVYEVGRALRVVAERVEARVTCGKSEVWLEPGEEAFIRALLGQADPARGQPKQKSRPSSMRNCLSFSTRPRRKSASELSRGRSRNSTR